MSKERPNDSGGSGPTSAQKSRTGAEPNATTTERALLMRASLGARRDAETLLAEASQLRRAAAADADTMVAEAEMLAEQLLAESRQAAEKNIIEAQERAEGILARARAEAAELEQNTELERTRIREEVLVESRVEIVELQARSDLLLRQVELGVHGLGPALEGAMSVVQDVIGSLEKLRSVIPWDAPDLLVDATDATDATETTASPGPTAATEVVVGTVSEIVPAAPPEAGQSDNNAGDDDGARPLGWLFRAGQS